MTYLRPQAALSGCACRGKGGALGSDGLGSLGDVVDPTQVQAIGAPAGIDPVAYLIAHLNRYTAAAGAPIAFQIASSPLPISSVVNGDIASRALWVLTRRAGAANLASADPATRALMTTVGQAWVNPAGYVRANLPAVIDVVRLFADLNALPKAVGVPQIDTTWADMKTPAIVVGILGAAYLMLGKRGRRR